MSDLGSSIQSQLKSFDTRFSSNHILQELENRTKLPKSYLAIGAAFVYLLLIFINVGGIGEILANIAGFVVPAYLSLIAVKSAGKEDDTQLLTYWIVFAFLNVIEFWSKAILYLVPFYWFIKTVFLLYLALPQTGGANMVYNVAISPIADKYILPRNKKTDDIRAAVSEAAGRTTGASVH
ncbi:hypothetical protein HG536_0B04260 [Torulaspora globosa]|uniref:Protein YOP1 n=1 Tax=Torulaspora globosa TaxID=48254 RepID=A0A7G3ZDH6_9SACH|nr:uncharacterized protein HG536_0B04260 [Torulaspora globosa]QLL31562.1 hypothetical protein HG536_0B04260 [Torulaspora globosa]